MSEVVLLIFPLNNFDSNVESRRLDDKTCLRQTNNNELKRLKESATGYVLTMADALRNVNYVLETKIEYDDLEHDMNQQWPYVRDVVLALRLLKAGDVNVSCSFWLVENGIIGFSVPSSFSEIFFENPYFLKKEEITSFKALWKKLQKLENDKPYLKFPLAQFTKAFEERASGMRDDATVDYIVALESLVFYEEDRSIEPAGKVIGMTIGMLLGNNEKERNKIKKRW